MFNQKKVIIFDMDGTLIDSIGIWNESDISLIKRLGCKKNIDLKTIQKEREETLGLLSKSLNPYLDYCKVLKEKYNLTKTPEEIYKLRYEIANEYLINNLDYKPYVPLFLKKLKEKKYILVIASTTMQKNIEIYKTKNKNIIKKAPLDEYFSLILTKEDVKESKPNPEVYLKVLEKLNVSKEECLIFEDSLVGVQAAKNSGIECVAVYDEYADVNRREINELADYHINSYQEAIALLDK